MAAPVLWGSKFLVNTTTTGQQISPSTIALPNGTFLVVWCDTTREAGDIRGQIFNADGSRKGSEFNINSATAGEQSQPVVTVLKDGKFVVAWRDLSNADGESDGGIRARIFNIDGSPFDRGGSSGTNDFLVNTTKENAQQNPSITALENGGFVIAYQVEGPSLNQVKAQSFNSNGQLIGPEVIANGTTTGSYITPKVAALSGGNYVVVYETASEGLKGRVLDAAGNPVPGTAEFNISSGNSSQREPSVTTLADGRFVVVWTHADPENGGDGSGSCVKAQIFSASGVAAGAELRVNVNTQGSQGLPHATALRGGGFAVVFGAENQGDSFHLVAFNSQGERTSDELSFQVAAGANLTDVKVTELADGRLFIAHSYGVGGGGNTLSALSDTVSNIFGQIIDPRTSAISLPGTAADDQYIGTAFNDTLSGGAGVDHLRGEGGDDILDGGAGYDTLDGGAGFDFASYASATSGVFAHASGSSDGDTFLSIEGVIGSAYADTFFGNGAMTFHGQGGDDTYSVMAGDVVVEGAGGGRDTVVTTASYTLSRDAQVEVLKLLAVRSTTTVNLTGSDFANTITGHAGTNTLKGEGGNDILYGDYGNDKLYGGNGKDIFVFSTPPHERKNVDRIYDFKPKDDSFWIENKYFPKLGSGSVSKPKKFKPDMFVKGKMAQDKEDRVVYDSKKGALYFDPDGTGFKPHVKIATLPKNLKMTYADFFVI